MIKGPVAICASQVSRQDVAVTSFHIRNIKNYLGDQNHEKLCKQNDYVKKDCRFSY